MWSLEPHSAAGSKETTWVSTLGTWSEKHGLGYGVLSLQSPCMYHAESKKNLEVFSENPASMIVVVLASSFFHSWQTWLFCNSAGRCILKKILLNNTWQIFYSLRNAVTECSYTWLQVKFKSLWNDCCSYMEEERLPCPFLAVFWIWYLMRESWFTLHLCCAGKDFSFWPKTSVSECHKYCPMRHFIMVASHISCAS